MSSDVTREQMIKYLQKKGYDVATILDNILKGMYLLETNKKNTLNELFSNNNTLDKKSMSINDSDDDSDSAESDSEKKDIDEKHPKVKILLKLLNGIMKNMGKAEIASIFEFKDIDKDEIIKKENEILLDKYEKDIFMYFDKIKCAWHRRTTTKSYMLTFLRCACKQLQIKFVNKKTQLKADGKLRLFVLYSIV